MNTNNFKQIVINKNRGWRGLAEVVVRNEEYKNQLKMIFSFSQAMWNDLIIKNTIVIQDNEYYYIIKFSTDDTAKLPRVDQQRSVLIKNFYAKINEVNKYKKTEWTSAKADDWSVMRHFVKNKNNHTTSDWNCIGIRVIPEI